MLRDPEPALRLTDPPTRPLLLGVVAGSLLAAAAPPLLLALLADPHPTRPWAFVLANLVHTQPYGAALAGILLYLAGPYLQGTRWSWKPLAGLYLGAAACGHLVAGALAWYQDGRFASPAAREGDLYASSALLLLLVWDHRRNVVSLYGGLLTVRWEQALVAWLVLRAALVLQTRSPLVAGELATALVALASVSAPETRWYEPVLAPLVALRRRWRRGPGRTG